MRRPRPYAWVLLVGLVCPAAHAHEVRPGYLELRQVGSDAFDVLWKVPARGALRLGLDVRLPDGCEQSERVTRSTGAAFVERWRARCANGLVGRELAIEGLSATRTDVLARVEHLGGGAQTVRLTPDAPAFVVAAAATRREVAFTYFGLGVEHILLGLDHLLFVLALLFLVGSVRRLVGTVTSFTLAHSLTLVAAGLGWVRVAQAPVEATIALSIVLVAAECVRSARGEPSLTARRPWLVAFAFGLLHGLGFAGALREVGLPDHAVPLALFCFNLGVEAGQLLFIASLLAVAAGVVAPMRAFGRGAELEIGSLAARVCAPAAYGIGIVAVFWLLERTLGSSSASLWSA